MSVRDTRASLTRLLWDQGWFIVQKKKTEGHEGHDIRFVPLWPEVRVPLCDACEQAEHGAEYVITITKFCR